MTNINKSTSPANAKEDMQMICKLLAWTLELPHVVIVGAALDNSDGPDGIEEIEPETIESEVFLASIARGSMKIIGIRETELESSCDCCGTNTIIESFIELESSHPELGKFIAVVVVNPETQSKITAKIKDKQVH